MRKPSTKQLHYARDISDALGIPLPETEDMTAYATYIAEHMDDYYKFIYHDPPPDAGKRRQAPKKPKPKVPEVEARIKLQTINERYSDDPLETPASIVKFLQKYMKGFSAESLVVLNLNTAGQVINYSRAAIGTINSAYASAADIFKTAILSNAAKIVIAHNHLSGSCRPSRPDQEITATVAQAGQILGIPLLDHIIVCTDDKQYYSFLESNPQLLANLPIEARYPISIWEGA